MLCFGHGASSLQLSLLLGFGVLSALQQVATGTCLGGQSSGSPQRVAVQTSQKKLWLSDTETFVATAVVNITSRTVLNSKGFEDEVLFSVDVNRDLLAGTACATRNRTRRSGKSWIVARLWYGGSYLEADGSRRMEQLAFPHLHLRMAAERHPKCEHVEEEALVYDPEYEGGLQQVVVETPHGSNWIRIVVQKMQQQQLGDQANVFVANSNHAPIDFAVVNVTLSCATDLIQEPCFTSYMRIEGLLAGIPPNECYGAGTCVAIPFSQPAPASGLIPSRCECYSANSSNGLETLSTGFACQQTVLGPLSEDFLTVTIPLRRWRHFYVDKVPPDRPPLFAEATLLPGFPRYSMDTYGAPFIVCIQPVPAFGADPIDIHNPGKQFGAHCDLVGASAGRISHSKVYNTDLEDAQVYLVSIYGREILHDNLFINPNTFRQFATDTRTERTSDMGVASVLSPQRLSTFNVAIRASWSAAPCPSYWNDGVCNGTGDCQLLRNSEWLHNTEMKLDVETSRQYWAFNKNFTTYQRQLPPAYCKCDLDPVSSQTLIGPNCESRVTVASLSPKRDWKRSGRIGWAQSETIYIKLPEAPPPCIQVSMVPLPCLSVWDPQTANERLLFGDDVVFQRYPVVSRAGNASARLFSEYRRVLQANLDVRRYSYLDGSGRRVIRLYINGQNCWPSCMADDRSNMRSYFGSSVKDDSPYAPQACPSLDAALAKASRPATYSLTITTQTSCQACERYKCKPQQDKQYNWALLGLLGALPLLGALSCAWWRRGRTRPRGRTVRQGSTRRTFPQTSVPDDIIATFPVFNYKAGQPVPKKPIAGDCLQPVPGLIKVEKEAMASLPFLQEDLEGHMPPDRALSSDMSITIRTATVHHSMTLSEFTSGALSTAQATLSTELEGFSSEQEAESALPPGVLIHSSKGAISIPEGAQPLPEVLIQSSEGIFTSPEEVQPLSGGLIETSENERPGTRGANHAPESAITLSEDSIVVSKGANQTFSEGLRCGATLELPEPEREQGRKEKKVSFQEQEREGGPGHAGQSSANQESVSCEPISLKQLPGQKDCQAISHMTQSSTRMSQPSVTMNQDSTSMSQPSTSTSQQAHVSQSAHHPTESCIARMCTAHPSEPAESPCTTDPLCTANPVHAADLHCTADPSCGANCSCPASLCCTADPSCPAHAACTAGPCGTAHAALTDPSCTAHRPCTAHAACTAHRSCTSHAACTAHAACIAHPCCTAEFLNTAGYPSTNSAFTPICSSDIAPADWPLDEPPPFGHTELPNSLSPSLSCPATHSLLSPSPSSLLSCDSASNTSPTPPTHCHNMTHGASHGPVHALPHGGPHGSVPYEPSHDLPHGASSVVPHQHLVSHGASHGPAHGPVLNSPHGPHGPHDLPHGASNRVPYQSSASHGTSHDSPQAAVHGPSYETLYVVSHAPAPSQPISMYASVAQGFKSLFSIRNRAEQPASITITPSSSRATTAAAMTTMTPAVSRTQCDASTTQCDASTTQCDASTTQCDASTTQCDASTTQCGASTTQCDASTAQCDLSTAQCDLSTTQCDASTSQCGTSVARCGACSTHCDACVNESALNGNAGVIAPVTAAPHTGGIIHSSPNSSSNVPSSNSSGIAGINRSTEINSSSTVRSMVDSSICTVNTRSSTVDTRSNIVDERSNTVDTTSSTVDTASGTVVAKSSTVDTTSSTVDTKSSAIDERSNRVDTTSSTVDTARSTTDANSDRCNTNSSLVNTNSSLVNTHDCLVNSRSTLINTHSSMANTNHSMFSSTTSMLSSQASTVSNTVSSTLSSTVNNTLSNTVSSTVSNIVGNTVSSTVSSTATTVSIPFFSVQARSQRVDASVQTTGSFSSFNYGRLTPLPPGFPGAVSGLSAADRSMAAHQLSAADRSMAAHQLSAADRSTAAGGLAAADQPTGGDDGDEDDRTCMICLLEYEESEEIMILPCWHAFHTDCIKQWMANHVTCPACRYCLVPDMSDGSSTGPETAETPSAGAGDAV